MAGQLIPLRRLERTFDDTIEAFREYLISEGFAPRTIYIKVLYLSRSWVWLAEHRGVTLDDAGPTDIAALAESMPPHRSTRAHVRGALRDYWAMTERVRAPVKAIRLPRKAKALTRALSDDEIMTLLAAAEGDHPAGTAVMFGYYLALRRSEIADARWDGFDREQRWYTLEGAKGGGLAALPVHPALRQQIGSVERGATPWLFPGRRGRPYVTAATIGNWVRTLSDNAGIEGMHPHRLRHTALARANDTLGDLRAVCEFARHARVETTMGYTRTTAQKLEAVSEALTYPSEIPNNGGNE